MKIIEEEKYLKEKEKEKDAILCPKCNVEMEFDGNNITEHLGFWKAIFGKNNIKDAWFKCLICKKRYLVKDYAKEVVDE